MAHILSLERAKGRDAAAIALLSRDHIEDGLRWTWGPNRVGRAMASKDTLTVVAREVDRQVCGFALMQYGLTAAHLMLLAVLPEYRGQGLGSRLLDWQLTCARTAGIGLVHLETRQKNAGAIRFYERHGFEIAGALEGYYQRREDAYRMTLEVRGPDPID